MSARLTCLSHTLSCPFVFPSPEPGLKLAAAPGPGLRSLSTAVTDAEASPPSCAPAQPGCALFCACCPQGSHCLRKQQVKVQMWDGGFCTQEVPRRWQAGVGAPAHTPTAAPLLGTHFASGAFYDVAASCPGIPPGLGNPELPSVSDPGVPVCSLRGTPG